MFILKTFFVLFSDEFSFEGLETFAMAEISIFKYGGGTRSTDAEAKDIRLLLPLLLEIPLHNLPSDVRPGHRLEVWSYDEGRGKGCHHDISAI